MGDCNAKAGNDSYLAWPVTIVCFSNELTKERGERYIYFADTYILLLGNILYTYCILYIEYTLFNHNKSRIGKRHFPHGLTHNQID